MFNIVDEIDNYQAFILGALQTLSDEQVTFLSAWCTNGLLSLPNTLPVIQQKLGIDDTKDKIVGHILQRDISPYQQKLQQLLDSMDEYSASHEELEAYESYALAAFNAALNSADDIESLAYALEVVINLIDHYAQTEDETVWNPTLKQEFDAQHAIVNDLLKGRPVTVTSHHDFLIN
ncbi:hypothetical protein K0P33_00340 [Pseudomonas sp. ArH3a]|uniref:hypothetical protein n=1 Tax=unclassified Pseudomonas TaxID=196821 RepID=UPI001F5A3293|nr:hypothetical protein [Pseudomonas sp. ArH3a]UNM19965.1 hypothetical protein K0P33_00340 [Pseudomonas sp. ArH3a]